MDNMENNMTFEAAIERLSEIVSALEGQNATLDGSLALFEEGIALVKLCNQRIESAEQRVVMLTEAEEGMKEVPFDEE